MANTEWGWPKSQVVKSQASAPAMAVASASRQAAFMRSSDRRICVTMLMAHLSSATSGAISTFNSPTRTMTSPATAPSVAPI